MLYKDLYIIGDIPGFTPQISRLVSMLNYVRHTTLSAVKDLTTRELDYLHNATGNSIGALLLHIAATETGYQEATFYNRHLNEEENNEWDAVITLGEKARLEIKGYELNYYLKKLEEVRAKTLAELVMRNDQWLEEETSFGDSRINNYFKWFHVLTHEVNHKGHINMLLRQAKEIGRY